MIGPQVQKALVAALKGATAAGPRVYDGVPKSATYPYVVIGEEQSVDEGDQCHDLFEVFDDIHVWSQKQGSLVEAKQIAEEVRKTLTDNELSVEGYALIELTFQNGRVLRDPDGSTAHAVMTFRLLLQAP